MGIPGGFLGYLKAFTGHLEANRGHLEALRAHFTAFGGTWGSFGDIWKSFWDTVENHSNEHASNKSPALTNVFEGPNNFPFNSLLLKVA